MENTVLILGAGFSKPYGYPTGPELVKQITKRGENSPRQQLSDLAKDLKDYGSYSIDKFLFENKEKHHEVGIDQIVQAISQAEIRSLTKDVEDDDDIIKLLLDEVSPENFPKLKIITFNYDRLLEWKFLKKLAIKYGDHKKAEEAFSKLKIIHIHGRMPTLRKFETKKSAEEFDFVYGLENASPEHVEYVKNRLTTEWAKSFNTIFTSPKEPNLEAVNALKWAKRVFFLGFAYDDLNMSKLGINNPNIIYDWESKYIAGTKLGMAKVQLNRLIDKYPFLDQRLFDVNCKTFFTDCFDLTNSKTDPVKSEIKEKSCCESHLFQNPPNIPKEYFALVHGHETTCFGCNKPISLVYKRADFGLEWELPYNPFEPKLI